MIHELRTYTSNPGRLADVAETLKGFASTLFPRHGFEPVAFWLLRDHPVADDAAVYLLRWDDVTAQRRAWEAFRADPAWAAFLAESRERGPAIRSVDTRNLELLEGYRTVAALPAPSAPVPSAPDGTPPT